MSPAAAELYADKGDAAVEKSERGGFTAGIFDAAAYMRQERWLYSGLLLVGTGMAIRARVILLSSHCT